MFSKRTWSGLSADDQGLIKKLAREAQFDERKRWEEYEQKAFEKMKQAGIEVVQIADKKPFQDAVKPVWDKYGPKYKSMIERIQAVQ